MRSNKQEIENLSLGVLSKTHKQNDAKCGCRAMLLECLLNVWKTIDRDTIDSICNK